MQTKTYKVLRDHIGGDGKLYSPKGANDTREAIPNEVAHLIPQTLVEIKAETAPEQKAPAKVKAAKAAPENKAEPAPDKAETAPEQKDA